MATNFIDQNGISCFVDQNGVTAFVDQNGDLLICDVVPTKRHRHFTFNVCIAFLVANVVLLI